MMHELQLRISIASIALQYILNIIKVLQELVFHINLMIFHPATAAVVLRARKEYGHEWWIGNLRSDVGGRHRGSVTFFFTTPT
jgi:hypothetical protein